MVERVECNHRRASPIRAPRVRDQRSGPGGLATLELRGILRRSHVPGIGPVKTWCDITKVDQPFVSFRWTFEFEADGAMLISDSTLRFRSRAEIERSLERAGYAVEEVLDAPDRPGLELVFVARRR